LLLNHLSTLPDIPIFLLKKPENYLSPYKSSEILMLINNKKLQELIMTVCLEKILNGKKMDQELPQLLMLFISEFQDTIYIIPKLMLIPLFLELLPLKISNLPKEELLTVSKLLMKNLITGNYVLLMDNLHKIGFVPSLKLLDYLALKKEKLKKLSKKLLLLNLC